MAIAVTSEQEESEGQSDAQRRPEEPPALRDAPYF